MSPSEKKLALIEELRRFRRAQGQVSGNLHLAAVGVRLEDEIGATVSQRIAGKALGVSHTALQRWIKRGDIPTVLTSNGRREIPLLALVKLVESVEKQKSAGVRTRHFIELVVMRDRARAQRIRTRRLRTEPKFDEDPHERALRRAREYHLVVARRLNRQMVDEARANLLRWRRAGTLHPQYAARWEAVLSRPLSEIKRTIVSDDDLGRDLRQNTPFAGALSEAERNAIFDRVVV